MTIRIVPRGLGDPVSSGYEGFKNLVLFTIYYKFTEIVSVSTICGRWFGQLLPSPATGDPPYVESHSECQREIPPEKRYDS
jgi:hypothetical protein